MSSAEEPGQLARRAAELRQLFDRSFALPWHAEAAGTSTLIGISVSGHPYALHFADISGIYADQPVRWLPGPVAELMGVTGLRGTVVPVYDLGMLLGFSRTAAARWLVVAAGVPVALAFERFDDYLRAPAGALVPEGRAGPRPAHVREILHTDVPRAVIHLPSVLATIRQRCGQGS